jgi:uncharacterized membrane-anchored protein YitT (DUF2179 family)
MRLAAIVIGALLVSVGLELFLTPHKIIPGGIKGIAVILSHQTEMKMGLFLLFINSPFVIYNFFRNVSKALSSLIPLLLITLLTLYMHPFPPFIQDPLFASICGGITLGVGIGLVVRYGWYADGVTDVAIYLKKKSRLTIGEIVMIVNISILGLGGFLFGWNQAFYSIIAYFLAYKTMEHTLGFYSKKMVWISFNSSKDLAQILVRELKQNVQVLDQETRITQHDGLDLFLVISATKLKAMKAIVLDVDPSAQIVSYTNYTPSDAYFKMK